jgi:hypothetical protein
MGTEDAFPGMLVGAKRLGREADQLLDLVPGLKMNGPIPLLPQMPSCLAEGQV